MENKIKFNLETILENINRACDRSKRNPENIHLIAVTKSVDVAAIRTLLDMGQLHFGESRPQELIQRNAVITESIHRRRELPGLSANPQPIVHPRWHMVGHLQRNKVKHILPIIDFIHSIDSLRLAEEINTAAARLGMENKIKVLLQVNTSQEKQKYGLAVGAVSALAEQVQTLPNLQVCGLMTMAPFTEDENRCRFCFSRLREIFDEMRGEHVVGPSFTHLSMGMSQDYEIAVEEGATMLRIGSALFT